MPSPSLAQRLGLYAVAATLGLTACVADGDPDRSAMGPPDGGPRHMAGTSVVTSQAGFLASMISHHEEAIAAAGELARSQRPRMRALGRSIVEGQTREVGMMRDWLARDDPGRPAAPYTPMMRDLAALSGDDLDRTFLQDMVGHHVAAVMMSRHALAAGLLHDPEVVALARHVVTAQRREIALMLRWSHDWFGTGPWGGAGPMRR